MATDARTARIDVTWSDLEALAWCVWFSAPAAPAALRDQIDDLHAKILAKRRQLVTPASIAGAPEAQLRVAEPQ